MGQKWVNMAKRPKRGKMAKRGAEMGRKGQKWGEVKKGGGA